MPALKNPRHEAFAQALARGVSASAAYVEAGYKTSTTPRAGRAAARSFAVPLPLRKKEVAEQRGQLKRHRQMTQLNRPALSQYWWATHLRQLQSTFTPTRKEANDNGQFEK